MARYWHLINIDKRQIISFEGLSQALTEPHGFDRMLVLSVFLPLKSTLAGTSCATSATADGHTSLGRLELPNEIIHSIFDQIDDPEDAVCLSLSHRRLRAIGRRHVFTLLRRERASFSWIGDRLICVDGEDTHESLPEGLLTAAEENALRTWTEEDVESLELDLTLAELNGVGTATCLKVRCREVEAYQWQPTPRKRSFSRIPMTVPYVTSERVRSAFETLIRRNYHARHRWVLCNLSKRVFVDIVALARLADEETPTTPFLTSLGGFAHVLLARTAWASSPPEDMYYAGNIHRGVWAGDRFEILTMDRLDRLRENEEWVDSSPEVVEELKAIWKSEFQDNWKDAISNHGYTGEYYD
ncbi:hypothetical protein BV25DRAFT_1357333 [Artomyces pyxidatus]|uniref:Uncharacterized protein n=1 Tax=Artomyces pyxidatus TaxID=48021 RepID=A0ACB8SNE5_9AGAM|nr:hypothetical protein BV25DRAFT_1357333 [Artomyces pyxidatus]